MNPDDITTLLRRASDTLAILEGRLPFAGRSNSPRAYLGQVYSGGSLPTSTNRFHLTHPVTGISGTEGEGQTATLTVDSSTSVPVLVLDGPMAVGDYLEADLINGIWVAEKGQGSGGGCTFTLTFHVTLGPAPCDVSGATVSLSWTGGSASGTTNSSGLYAASLSVAPSTVISYTVTPPSGHGAASYSGTYTVPGTCPGPTTITVALNPDSTHVNWVCNGRYLPKTFSYSDDYGSCTLTWGTSTWTGSYTYTSAYTIAPILCAYSGNNECLANQTGSVLISITLTPSVESCTSSAVLGLDRAFAYANGQVGCATAINPTPARVCQFLQAGQYTCATAPVYSPSIPSVTLDCSTTSLSASVSISAFTPPSGCTTSIPETAVTATITGTI